MAASTSRNAASRRRSARDPSMRLGKLEEVAHQDHLQATERGLRCPDMTADRIDQAQGARWQHRDLIDDKDARLLDARGEAAIRGEDVEIAAGECLAYSDAAPSMNGDAMTVGGGDAGRSGKGIVDALPLEVADVSIDRMGLAAAGLAGEEYARPGLEQGKRLVLGHALLPSASLPSARHSL